MSMGVTQRRIGAISLADRPVRPTLPLQPTVPSAGCVKNEDPHTTHDDPAGGDPSCARRRAGMTIGEESSIKNWIPACAGMTIKSVQREVLRRAQSG